MTRRTRIGDGTSIMAKLRLALLCAAAWAGCSYDPHPADGTLGCGPGGECPTGYTCRAAVGTCFSTTAATTGTGGVNGSGGGGPGSGGADMSGPVSSTAADYVGSWAFGVAAVVDTSCDDGSQATTMSLADHPNDPNNRSIMTVVAGGTTAAPLRASWLCTTNLFVDGSGAHYRAIVGPCTQAGTDPNGPLSSTWTVSKFELSVRTNNRVDATHTADYTRVDTYAAGRIVTCSQRVRASLRKL